MHLALEMTAAAGVKLNLTFIQAHFSTTMTFFVTEKTQKPIDGGYGIQILPCRPARYSCSGAEAMESM